MRLVLIAEDNPTWATMLASYVEQLNLACVVVNSPQAAMDAVDEYKPAVIILDMLLATETGMALLSEMRGYEDLSHLPVIVCSSVSGIELKHLQPFGVKYLFDKATVEPEDIRAAIRSLVSE